MKSAFFIPALLIFFYSSAQPKEGKLLWKFFTQNKIVTTVCINNDRIYYGSCDGNFYCNDLKNGKIIWKYKTGKAIKSSAVVAEGKVYFGCDDGNIYALDTMQGNLKWKFATEGEYEYDMWDYYRSSPRYANGKLYAGSGDGNIYAIQAETGKELWHFSTGDVVHSDPVISNDTLFIGSFDGNFYAINSNNGNVIWKFKTIGDRYFPKGEVQKAALVTDDAVYFGSRDYNLYALNKKTGTGLWNMKEYGSWIIATPLLKDNNLFFGTSDSHAFYSLNIFYGEQQWKAALPLRSFDTPAFFDTLIIAGCYNGFLYGFGEKTGNVEWVFQTDGSKKNYSSVYESDGNFRKDFTTFGDDSTARAGEQKVLNLGSIISSPVIKNSIVYFGSTDGNLYAVKIE
jgi:eukaryotic-like serine/threonine-protein kinase